MRKYFARLRKIDSHAHLIDKHLQKRPTTKPFLEDSFTRYDAQDVIKSSKSSRIIRSIVFPLPSSAVSTKTANRMVLEASMLNKHIVPVAFLREEASAREIQRYYRQGFKGFKVYSDIPERLANLLERCGLPVILHPPFFPSSNEFHALINRVGGRFPIILSHFGRARTLPEAIEFIRLIKPFSNIYVDTSGFVGKFKSAEFIIRVLGPNRILYGTDRPFSDLRGTSMVLTKSVHSSVPDELVGQSRFLTDEPYKWNNPVLIALFKKLHLGKESMGQRSDRVLEQTVSQLISRGVLTRSDVKKIFFSNARRIFKL